MRTRSRVVAFEPAAVNYFLLAANCEASGVSRQVDCLPIGLGSESAVTRFEASQFESGKSFNSGATDDERGQPGQAALILPVDQLVEQYGLACPNYIKIAAPGASEAIIAGAARTYRRPEVRQVHLEVRETSKGAHRMLDMLNEGGFVATGRDVHGGSADLTFDRVGER